MHSEIGGINTTVAQIQAQLADAKWDLGQTTVRAPANGIVTLMALTVGDRALQARAVMSFIVTPPRHARQRDRVRGQCRRDRALDVDPGVDQLLHGVSVND